MSHSETDKQAQVWKKKYYDALDDLESKEKQWQKVETLLRQSLSRLTLLADEVSPQLARQLDELRKLLRDGRDSYQLRAILAGISDGISRLDEQRSAKKEKPDPNRLMAELLGKLKVPKQEQARLRKLQKQFYTTDGETVEIETLAGFLNLLLLPPAEKSDAEPKEKAGLLSRLLGKDEAEDTRRKSDTIVDDAAQGVAHKEEVSTNFTVAAEVLLQILERLSLPEPLDREAESIKQTLVSDVDWETLARGIASTTELVAIMRVKLESERTELESFLRQLTLRLREIDDGLKGTAQLNQESRREGEQLNEAVASEVSNIEDALTAEGDVDRIKAAVQVRLQNIRKHMASFGAAQQTRGEEAETIISELTQRLQQTEAETEQLRSQLEEAHKNAMHDSLTGALNRLAYEERLTTELSRLHRSNTPMCLMVWDVDHFKKINDTYGHQAGDKVLKVMVEMLQARVRAVDMVARYGGEEFVIILSDIQLADAAKLAEQLREAIATLDFHYRETAVPITASCGLTQARKGDDNKKIFERADKALYRAKSGGRNRVVTG